MNNFFILHCDDSLPESVLQRFCEQHERSVDDGLCVVVHFNMPQYWLQDEPVIALTAIYFFSRDSAGDRLLVTVSDNAAAVVKALSELQMTPAADQFRSLIEDSGLPCFSAAAPVPLKSVCIPKPWGQEIWYTGVEERGVALVESSGGVLPLPWLLAALPERLCGGRQRELILLKILDPLPEPVFGDLYFELHEEKREVYVVTAVDQSAWPDGTGAIRYGFDPDMLASYENEAAFKAAYVESVKAYREVRQALDGRIDKCRLRDGVGLNEPVSAETLRDWLAELPEALRKREGDLRAAMDAFTRLLPLAVGDVVKVPTLTPHSLQHGVRTVEFQTPVYERLIVSFAQKVLTQKCWDTEQAAQLMVLSPPEQPAHEPVFSATGIKVERIVDFEDFEVLRASLAPGAAYQPPASGYYGLAMGISGAVHLAGVALEPELALLIPPGQTGRLISNQDEQAAVFLLAYPK